MRIFMAWWLLILNAVRLVLCLIVWLVFLADYGVGLFVVMFRCRCELVVLLLLVLLCSWCVALIFGGVVFRLRRFLPFWGGY